MALSTTLAAATPPTPPTPGFDKDLPLELGDAVEILLFGFGWVLVALAILWALMVLSGIIIRKTGLEQKSLAAQAPTPAPVAAPAARQPMTPERVAVIAAAVSQIIGEPFKIVSVKEEKKK